LQRLELIFNGGHRLGYKLWQIAPTGRRFVHNDVITRPFREPECAPAHVVYVYRSPRFAACLRKMIPSTGMK
jgi:hypothetical protein